MKKINISFDSISGNIMQYITNLTSMEKYANITMLVGILLIISAVILW